MHQQLWGYKVEEKLYLGVREKIRFNTTAIENHLKWIVDTDCGTYKPAQFSSEYSGSSNDLC
jgi:hypothetical protein